MHDTILRMELDTSDKTVLSVGMVVASMKVHAGSLKVAEQKWDEEEKKSA